MVSAVSRTGPSPASACCRGSCCWPSAGGAGAITAAAAAAATARPTRSAGTGAGRGQSPRGRRAIASAVLEVQQGGEAEQDGHAGGCPGGERRGHLPGQADRLHDVREDEEHEGG